jgi:hypothetical protein
MEFLQTLEPARCKEAVTRTLISAGRHNPHAYPFGNPVSIEKCHLPIVRSVQYWVTEKTDGTRVCLMFTTSDKNIPMAVLMDRVGNMYGFPCRCESELFAGSVFDTELVYDALAGTYALYVFDAAMLEGELLRTEGLSERLEIIADVVSSIASNLPNLTLRAKQMFPLSDIPKLLEMTHRGGHASDGYILTPEREQASMPGTAWAIFKIKSIHTLDLLWIDGVLWYGSGEELLRMDALPDWEVEHVATDFTGVSSGSIVECAVEIVKEGQLKLAVKLPRPDKTVPNNALCVIRTIASIRDAVSIHDVIQTPLPLPRPLSS